MSSSEFPYTEKGKRLIDMRRKVRNDSFGVSGWLIAWTSLSHICLVNYARGNSRAVHLYVPVHMSIAPAAHFERSEPNWQDVW